MTVSVRVVARAAPEMWIDDDLAALAEFVSGQGVLPRDAEELAERLYGGWFLNIAPADAPSGPPMPAERDLASALAAAHAGGSRFEPGWIADRVSSAGRVEAVAGLRRRIVRAGEYLDLDRPGRHPEPGDRLRLATPLSSVEGGFWVTRTMSWLDEGDGPLTRLYVNVSLAGAATAVALLTEVLEGTDTAYALKVSLQLGEVQRADALVVYVPRPRFAEVYESFGRVTARLQDEGQLAPGTPRLTARLRPGVGAADGVGTGSSYGQDRCMILARALAGHLSTTNHHGAGLLEETCRTALVDAGLDPSRPYLSADADHDYAPFA